MRTKYEKKKTRSDVRRFGEENNTSCRYGIPVEVNKNGKRKKVRNNNSTSLAFPLHDANYDEVTLP